MFADLCKYENEDFLSGAQNQSALIRCPALVNMRLWRHSRPLPIPNRASSITILSMPRTENAFDEYISQCKELALYDTGVTAEYGDRLITLSTCEYSRQNGRMVVVAKKIVSPSAEVGENEA